mmetsp:Transcript_27304/g.40310  ORF Transcript_27304/g.40310 Transcript_27304/m.40310 type:complete len:219 (+) Transcript_27304:187-843(+)
MSVLQPSIPMPPVGCSWLLDWKILAIALVVVLEFLGCLSVSVVVSKTALSVPTLLTVMILSILTVRFSVAFIVRNSISKAIQISQHYVQQNQVAAVVGFSWGGGVVAEMLRRGTVGGSNQPAVLLIAPTTALISRISMVRDPATVIRVEENHRVHVFHDSYDHFFCPHADRWAQSGISFHCCEDNHIFLSQYSKQALKETLINLIESYNDNYRDFIFL